MCPARIFNRNTYLKELLVFISDLSVCSLPLLMLYAEVHYRFFPFFPSILFKKEPEVLFDLPHRTNPGCDLPILLIINDIKHFPVQPVEVSITLSQTGNGTQLFTFRELAPHQIDHPLSHNQHVYLFSLPSDKLPGGEVFVNATVTLQKGSRTITVFNDNINGTSRRAFRCFISDKPLPGSTLCSYGDLHVHSQFSQSHVEFGPPVAVIDQMAATCGLTFAGITDHSYDLACRMSNYLVEDESLPRWDALHEQCMENTHKTILLPGEEISCGNSRGETVHLVGLGHDTFIPGSKDGARKNLKFSSQPTIEESVAAINREKGIAFAAHPSAQSGFLQRTFLHRGHWHNSDFDSDLHGFQALNSGFSRAWTRGKALWISLLMQGKKIALLAGNDAHGDFSRYRAIKVPFLSIYENFTRYMGYAKTGIYGIVSTPHDIYTAIKQGSTFVTTGPYLSIATSVETNESAIGKAVPTAVKTLYVKAISTSEFGKLRNISVYCGPATGTPQAIEQLLATKTFYQDTFDLIHPIAISNVPAGSYLRAEAETVTSDGTINRAFTSACYLA